MQRTMAVTSLAMLVLAVCVWTTDTWARAGGGKSTGSRGSRSWSSPEAGPSAPSSSRQAVPPSAVQPPMPQRSGWMSGLMGGIMGFALGGLLGSMLFGGLGGGLFNGIGLLEILLIGGLLYMGFAYLRRRLSWRGWSIACGGMVRPMWRRASRRMNPSIAIGG